MPTPDDREAWLSTLDLFGRVSAATLAAFAGACHERGLAPGEVLFREGDAGDFLFLIREGALDACAGEGDPGPPLRTLGPGELGGLTSITLGQPRSATLRAAAPTTLWTVARADVLRLLEERPDLARALIALLSAKVRVKTRRIAALAAPGATQRFRLAVFDTKPYDRESFEPRLGEDLHATWLTPRLDVHTAELAAGHQAVCAFVNDDLGADTLQRLSQLGVRLVAMRCAGYNNVDLEAAERLRIPVVRVPAYSPHAVAEHAVALLCTLNRHIHRAYNRVRDGNFSLSNLVGSDLHGRTAGVVGLGKIGQCAARILRGYGMRVLAHDLKPDAAFAAEVGVEWVPLEVLLAESDVVTLHAPLLPATHHMVDAASLARMKPGAFLINTSRGGLVDTHALIDALKAGRLGGAGLDVYEEESGYFFEDLSAQGIGDDQLARLMTFPNVIVTSHQAFLTTEALGNIAETTLSNVREFARGDAVLTHCVQRT